MCSGVGHGHHAAAAVAERLHKLVHKRSAPGGLAAAPCAARVAALQHEIADAAVERDAVIEAASREQQEVLACARHQISVQLQVQVALGGVKRDVRLARRSNLAGSRVSRLVARHDRRSRAREGGCARPVAAHDGSGAAAHHTRASRRRASLRRRRRPRSAGRSWCSSGLHSAGCGAHVRIPGVRAGFERNQRRVQAHHARRRNRNSRRRGLLSSGEHALRLRRAAATACVERRASRVRVQVLQRARHVAGEVGVHAVDSARRPLVGTQPAAHVVELGQHAARQVQGVLKHDDVAREQRVSLMCCLRGRRAPHLRLNGSSVSKSLRHARRQRSACAAAGVYARTSSSSS